MRRTRLGVLTGLVVFAVACGGGDKGAAPAAGSPAAGATSAAITGAGATFPNPIYQKWFDSYAKATGVRINYQSIGSGGGIRQFTEGTVDFGATDAPMTDQQMAAVNGDVLHVPTVIGAVVLTYNLPALGTTPLRLDGTTIAEIFLGKITRWNDAKLAALNPGVALPATDIIVVHRSDGSGTSFVFTDFLSKASPEWAQKVGKAPAVSWPIGLGGKGNEGVTQQVKQTEGSIGYVELIYALSNRLPYAQVKNAGGQFVTPDLKSVTAAAASATFAPDTDFRVSITNAPGAEAYPISSFTWLLIKPGLADQAKSKQIKDFLTWMLDPEAQRIASDLNYAPLPVSLIQLLQERVGR
jgi:phosphate transport system substrate-binding protein